MLNILIFLFKKSDTRQIVNTPVWGIIDHVWKSVNWYKYSLVTDKPLKKNARGVVEELATILRWNSLRRRSHNSQQRTTRPRRHYQPR